MHDITYRHWRHLSLRSFGVNKPFGLYLLSMLLQELCVSEPEMVLKKDERSLFKGGKRYELKYDLPINEGT